MKMLKSFSIYTFVGFFGAGINFFLMPLLSHYLTPSDFGITSIINTYVTLLFPILGMNAYGIISVEYYKTRDKKDFASLFSSVQFVPIIPTIIITAIGLMLYGRIAPLLELPPGELWV